jgi:argonaute-like protein implicated in RNA metabolism and viral defense
MKRLILAKNNKQYYVKGFAKECENQRRDICNDIRKFIDPIINKYYDDLKQELKQKVTEEIKNSSFEIRDKFISDFVETFENNNQYFQKLEAIAEHKDYSNCEPMFDRIIKIGKDFFVNEETAKSYFEDNFGGFLRHHISFVYVRTWSIVRKEVGTQPDCDNDKTDFDLDVSNFKIDEGF